MPELALSQMQIGWLIWASTVGYACFQFPGGILGQRLGGRRALFITGLLAAFGMVAFSLTPGLLSGARLFGVLLATQLVIGMAQAPLFPVTSGVLEIWLPSHRWAFAQGVLTMASQLGAAVTPPIVVLLMQHLGWQQALLWPVLIQVAFVVIWGWYARDDPRCHPSISPSELKALRAVPAAPMDRKIGMSEVLDIASNRSVLMLTMSYVSMNYVFYLLASWSFLYLIQERHFTVLQAGWLASLPPLGAAVGAGLGGGISDALCLRFGWIWGYRLVPLAALPAAGGLLLAVILGTEPFLAVAALVVCFAAVELTEGAFWAATMRIAQAETAAATGILNTGGVLGGIIGIPIVAYLSGHHEWNLAFELGSIFAALAALGWLGVNVERDQTKRTPHHSGR